MYTNLLLFLVAIFLFSVTSVPETPLLVGWQAFLLFGFSYFGFSRLALRLYSRVSAFQSSGYFSTEKQLSILAVCFFGVMTYVCDPKYYLAQLPFAGVMPALVNIAGLALFVLYLAFMWRAGRENYEQIFDRKQQSLGFIRSNIKSNLPIVLPWLVLSLLYDVVGLLPFPGLQAAFASEWGDLLFFGMFLVFVVLFFPPLVRRLWGCKSFPEGFLKDHLVSFCSKHNFSAKLYLWPLFEGRVLTAGVMGILPGLRYILLTPALIETMSRPELDAVMAHEIGHVKKRHLILYIFLIGCFSLLAGVLAEPFLYFFLSLGFVSKLVLLSGISVESVVTVVGAVPFMLFLLIYFRYIFSYFIRNFERQADLYSLQAIGSGRAMISAFEKISILSGNIRDQKNWHHFGIGERIDCLERAELDHSVIERQNKKVRYSLFAYTVVVLLTVFLVNQIPQGVLERRYQENFAESILLQKAKQEPERALWHRLIGDLMFNKKMEEKALIAYEKAFSLEPASPEIMNNFAWLMLTSENLDLRDPGRALTLARGAATLTQKGYVLDTLATAYWANGLTEEAVQTERQALSLEGGQKRYYQSQIIKFQDQSYEESLAELKEE